MAKSLKQTLALSILFLLYCCNYNNQLKCIKSYPLWTRNDTEIIKVIKQFGTFHYSPYTFILENKNVLPFYKGVIPLKFKIAYSYWGNPMEPSQGIPNYEGVCEWEFPSTKYYFIYSDDKKELKGARVFLFSGKDTALLAECKVDRIQFDRNNTFAFVTEVYYNSIGKPIFCGTSLFDVYTGIKLKELSTEGKKPEEYFFLLPKVINY